MTFSVLRQLYEAIQWYNPDSVNGTCVHNDIADNSLLDRIAIVSLEDAIVEVALHTSGVCIGSPSPYVDPRGHPCMGVWRPTRPVERIIQNFLPGLILGHLVQRGDIPHMKSMNLTGPVTGGTPPNGDIEHRLCPLIAPPSEEYSRN